MKLIVGKNTGFCVGVERAVDAAMSCAGGRACVLHELIHNSYIKDKLKGADIATADSVSEAAGYPTVIIRSHGEPPETLEYLNKHGCNIVDATCVFVKRIHSIADKYSALGYRILIAGKESHPEVAGIVGYCRGSSEIVDGKTDFNKYSEQDKLCLVAQTTFSAAVYAEMCKKIKNSHAKIVEVFDTICYTTHARQTEAAEIARKSDKILVIGDKSSSNTTKLFEICSQITDTYFVSGTDDLTGIDFKANDTVGLVTGASAPREQVTEVIFYMSDKEMLDATIEQETGAAESQPAVEAAPVAAESAPAAEAEAAPVKEDAKASMTEFEKAMAKIDKEPSFKEGRRYRLKVITADDKGISVAMTTGKRDGFIPAEEASLEAYNPADYKADDEIFAVLKSTKVDQATGCYTFSKKDIDLAKLADKEVDKIRDGSEFQLVVKSDTKGGLVGNIASYRVFIPSSHIKEGFPKDLKAYVGKTLRLSALEIDDEKHKIVASQKVLLSAEREKKEAEFWDRIEVNEIVPGKVLRATQFGAFVDVYGFDCLAHIGDLSWVRINKVEDVLTIGETYDFVILSADREKKKVSLGFKQINKHPFDEVIEKHPVGSVVKGKVVRLVTFGAFIEIEKGIDALLHLSEASHSYIKSIGEAVKVGDEVEAMITRIDPAARKISLSVKALTPAPEAAQEPAAPAEQAQVQDKPVKERAENPNAKRDFRRPAGGVEKKPRHDTRDDLPKEWSEDNSNNPFADLLKDIKLK